MTEPRTIFECEHGRAWFDATNTLHISSGMSRVALLAMEESMARELDRLQTAIRKHRDYRGDDRCWEDDAELYKTLPEGYEPPKLETQVLIENCQRFISCRQNPGTEYISPQRRIEQLESELAELRAQQRPLWWGKTCELPTEIATCPECNSKLGVHCTAYHEETGRPIESGIDVSCIADSEVMEHRYFQSDWQDIVDLVLDWSEAARGE